ncbi:MAG: hypothetical protein HC869_13650 [Rhodospirillales bacterium]|nr:hypothetical protein [Rhodospirillales bacterium]
MAFWRKLFGGGDSGGSEAGSSLKSADHKGFTIKAQPYKEGGQWQLAGTISKDVGGVMKEYRFVRADRFTDAGEAAEIALSKGRQIIDEQGERIFTS